MRLDRLHVEAVRAGTRRSSRRVRRARRLRADQHAQPLRAIAGLQAEHALHLHRHREARDLGRGRALGLGPAASGAGRSSDRRLSQRVPHAAGSDSSRSPSRSPSSSSATSASACASRPSTKKRQLEVAQALERAVDALRRQAHPHHRRQHLRVASDFCCGRAIPATRMTTGSSPTSSRIDTC